MAEPTSLAGIEAALLARWPENRIAPDLDRMRSVLAYLGDPHLTYPVIHVAGTNGKTSVARIIDALLHSFGLQTGRYTSPHLHSMRERVAIGGDPIGTDRFIAAYADISPALELADRASAEAGGPPLSYFEAITALAFAAFSDAPIDVAVVEVGLGGSWDATNAVQPVVSVITTIGLDHQEYLGETLEQIAAEKAGIIKPEVPVVVARQPADALPLVVAAARDAHADLSLEDVDFSLAGRRPAVGGQVLDIRGVAGSYDELYLPLYGEHQAHNATVAVAAVETFFAALAEPLDIDAVRDGIGAATSPVRVEVVRRSPTVIVDAAHNVDGARVLAATLTTEFEFTYLVGVLAILEGKDSIGILEALEPVLTDVIVTANTSSRRLDVRILREQAEQIFGANRVQEFPDLPRAITAAVELADASNVLGGVGVVVTGSVVTAAQARALLLTDGPDLVGDT